MKKLSSLLMALIILIAACNNKKPKDTVTFTSEDGKGEVNVDINKMQDAAKNMEKKKDELGKLTPLSLEQLKAMIPETLMGGKRKDYNVSSAMGAGLARGEYEINDSTSVKLNIYDCAGPGGAGIYSMQYLSMMNFQQESEDEYTKSIDFKGGKAYEHCNKVSNDCTITFFSGDRFLVTLEGENVGVDALKQAASALNIK